MAKSVRRLSAKVQRWNMARDQMNARIRQELADERAAKYAAMQVAETNLEPIPPDQQELPPHMVRTREPEDLPYYLRD